MKIITFEHRTVLKDAAIHALNIQNTRSQAVYVDATFGRGGHSRALLAYLGEQARLIALDKDMTAVTEGKQLEKKDPRFEIVHSSFAHLTQILQQRDIHAIAGILFDLGMSSPQVDDAQRGFSFRLDGPLDMRMDRTRGHTVAEWLTLAEESQIRDVIANYGEERFAPQIASAIVAQRAILPITTTRQLARLVANTVKTREKDKDPATRTFQALRIFINQELTELEQGLIQAHQHLTQEGRLVVISFHSLEDRIVKRFLTSKAQPPIPNHLPVRAVDLPPPTLRLLERLKPSTEEINANPRARSAILRVAEKVSP